MKPGCGSSLLPRAGRTRPTQSPILMLTQILDELGIAPHQAVMIGDSIHDMAMAEALAMPRIGVSWGVHDRARLLAHHPLAVVDTMAELQRLLD